MDKQPIMSIIKATTFIAPICGVSEVCTNYVVSWVPSKVIVWFLLEKLLIKLIGSNEYTSKFIIDNCCNHKTKAKQNSNYSYTASLHSPVN